MSTPYVVIFIFILTMIISLSTDAANTILVFHFRVREVERLTTSAGPAQSGKNPMLYIIKVRQLK